HSPWEQAVKIARGEASVPRVSEVGARYGHRGSGAAAFIAGWAKSEPANLPGHHDRCDGELATHRQSATIDQGMANRDLRSGTSSNVWERSSVSRIRCPQAGVP